MLARLRDTSPAAFFPALLLLFAAAFGPQVQRASAQGEAPAPGATITYEEAVRLALRRNYQLRLARNDVLSQSINVDQNRAQFYPSLSLSAGGRNSFGRNFDQQQGQIVGQQTQSVDLGASASINLFNGFRDDATLDASQARTQAAGRTLQRRRQDVVYQVLQRFIGLAQNRALVEVRQQQLELRQELLTQTEAQIEVGERAPSDVYQFQADVAAARQQLQQAQRNVEISQTELVRLLVLDPFGEYDFETTALEENPEAALTATPYQLDRLLATAYDERADLSAQRAAIAASAQGVRAARGGFWPRLDLSASYGSNWNSLSQRAVPGTGTPNREVQITPDGGGDPIAIEVPGSGIPPQLQTTPFFDQIDARRGGGISLSLSYPLFDRFQTRYGVEQAQVQLENQRFQEELLRQDIAVEVRQALIDYRNAQTDLDVTTERLQAARQAQEAAQERYRLGAATYVELAQANTELAQAQNDRVLARYDLLLQQRRLAYITGRLDPEAPLTR